jgi:tetratricopeptide (TPR) repeat protein
MHGTGVNGLSDEDAVVRIGYLVDAADDALEEEGIFRALEWSDEVSSRQLSNSLKMTLTYVRANAWAARYRRDVAGRPESWRWEQPLMVQQIYLLRQVLTNPEFEHGDQFRRCQVLTNLGNCLSSVGRFVEALEFYTRALKIVPYFWGGLEIGALFILTMAEPTMIAGMLPR